MSVNITFLGGTGTVTGSKYLVQHDGKKLLVDCGLFQGYKQLRLRNWNPMPIEATDVDAVLLTHAHLDHSGYVPLLYRQGYRGHIHATPATCDLCAILLPDSGHIQEEDAAFLNRHGYTKHEPAMPLYGKHDSLLSLQLLSNASLREVVLRLYPYLLWAERKHCFMRLRNSKSAVKFLTVCPSS